MHYFSRVRYKLDFYDFHDLSLTFGATNPAVLWQVDVPQSFYFGIWAHGSLFSSGVADRFWRFHNGGFLTYFLSVAMNFHVWTKVLVWGHFLFFGGVRMVWAEIDTFTTVLGVFGTCWIAGYGDITDWNSCYGVSSWI